ncbi:MAG: CotH kinase family protein [Bacteroidota bacterium]
MEKLLLILLLLPLTLLSQSVQFSEVVDEGPEWSVELKIQNASSKDQYEIRSGRLEFEIEIPLDQEFFLFELPKSPSYLRNQKSVFDDHHEMVYLIQNQQVVDSFPERCVPQNGAQIKIGGQWTWVNTATQGMENGSDFTVFQSQELNLNANGGYYTYLPIIEQEGIVFPGSEVKWNDGSQELNWDSPNLTAHQFNGEAPSAELSHIEASGYQIAVQGAVHTAHVRQFQIYQHGCPVSEVQRSTFFIGNGEAERYHLPVLSINTADENLFGDAGIYGYGASGYNFDLRGRNWERPATVEYFENGQNKLSQNVGIRIRGKSSRFSPQKSLKLYAREEYGKNKFDNVFFPELGDVKIKRLNLRTPHNDFIRSMTTDHLAAKLVEDLNIDGPMSQRCIVYLNGEYWGVYALQESMDEHYPETRYDINDDSVLEVDNDKHFPLEYQQIIEYVTVRPELNNDDMEWLSSRIDIPSLQEYYAAQIILSNWDWPAKNVKAWLSPEEGAPLRFFFFDCDACFHKTSDDNLERFYPERNTLDHSILFSTLLTHPGFQQEFFAVYMGMLKNTLNTENMLAELAEAKKELDPYMNDHIARWGYPQSRQAWELSMESIEFFSVRRHAEIFEDLDQMLGDRVKVYPNPSAGGNEISLSSYGILDNGFVYSIYDALGNLVQEGTSDDHIVQLSQLQPGQYFLSMNSGGLVFRTRFTVL